MDTLNPDDTNQSEIVLVNEVLPDDLVIVPVHDRPVFPGMVVPMLLTHEFDANGLEFILQRKKGRFGVVYLPQEYGVEPLNNEELSKAIPRFGTIGKVLRSAVNNNNEIQVLLNMQKRFEIEGFVSKDPYLIAKVSYPEVAYDSKDADLNAYVAALIAKIKDLVKHNSIFSEEVKLFMSRYGSREPNLLADLVVGLLTNVTPEEMQELLETTDLSERIPKVLHYVHKEVELSRVKESINKQIEEKISKQQRQFFLQEQLKSIKKELGLEKDEKSNDEQKFKEKLSKLALTEEAKKVAEEELEKLHYYDMRSSEYGVSRNYLQWITSLPWGITTKDNLVIPKVRKILNEDHYGLSEVKNRILEFVAVQKLKNNMSGSIICFVGPPGVGKTSFGKSIARALGRKFYNFSLGGMRDEAEIKGHRRTYIGAMPGKIVQALKSVESMNPVIMLDEIDKVKSSYQGDPSSALLEVLDPEQNNFFLDHYLDLRFDLSKILFIATANQLDTIPEPLLDRMEIIRLSGYLLEEKREIAKKFIVPKQLKNHGLNQSRLKFKDEAIDYITKHYARESGVRTLEQQIKKIMRKSALGFATGKLKSSSIGANKVKGFLGLERFKTESPYEKVVPGVVTGLAWTAMGGSTLYIESIVVSRGEKQGGLRLTGQLGKVMEESAKIAYAYTRSIADKYKVDEIFFPEASIHLHVPEGATPKDGPSAGITMALSILSLALKKTIPDDLAMTGELTVTGYVLPIGGVREKLIAAKRINKKKVIFPIENKRDYDELPAYIRKGVKVYFVRTFAEVTKIALKL